KDFVPHPGHRAVLERAPQPPGKSELFGRLRGENVILVTFESLGRDHLNDVHMPIFERRSLWSRHHLCLSPTTNNAHQALYSASYEAAPSLVGELRAAGFQTLYLTTIKTEYYGLRALLTAAEFEHVIDGPALGANSDE